MLIKQISGMPNEIAHRILAIFYWYGAAPTILDNYSEAIEDAISEAIQNLVDSVAKNDCTVYNFTEIDGKTYLIWTDGNGDWLYHLI